MSYNTAENYPNPYDWGEWARLTDIESTTQRFTQLEIEKELVQLEMDEETSYHICERHKVRNAQTSIRRTHGMTFRTWSSYETIYVVRIA